MALAMVMGGCDAPLEPGNRGAPAGGGGVSQQGRLMSFDAEVAFLKQHAPDTIVLGKAGGPQVAIVPRWQGRVMTSTADAGSLEGNGWINRSLIESGKIERHINVWGGEDRFWLGPEGGQFSVFFAKGDAQDFDHWQTPALIDTEAFDVRSTGPSSASFSKKSSLVNYAGTTLEMEITREVRLFDLAGVENALKVQVPKGVKTVGYESDNQVLNTGKEAWTKETGMPSVWILGMFKHSATTNVVAPYVAGPEATHGIVVNDDYFGKVDTDRLKVTKDFVAFKADGQKRSKIGLGPLRAKDVVGSWDPVRGLLTIVQYTKPEGVTDYVNSQWVANQEKPFGGDVVNSYNDGPNDSGSTLGPFYELETSSPAAALAPGGSIRHIHRTFHFRGEKADLQKIATAVLGVDLDEVAAAFK